MNAAFRVLLVGLCLAALWGCSDSTAPVNTTPPALPGISTLKPTLDFYGVAIPAIDQQALAAGTAGGALLGQDGDYSNFVNGVVRAFVLMVGAYDVLNEPIAAFAVAVNSVPQDLCNGSYVWTYIFIDPATHIEYGVFLYGTVHDGGKPHEDTVDWRMEVSTDNPAQPLDHFVWLRGESRADQTACHWQFYLPVNETDGVEAIEVDWKRLDGNETRLVLAVNGAGLPNEGDTLTFNNTKPESSIEYFDASEDFLSTIIWRTNGSGSLHVPDYNAGATACWNEHQVNTTCD